MSKRYIQIDSHYRNRKLYKNQSEFTLNVNTGNRGNTDANDPVSDDAPIKVWVDISSCEFIIDSSYNDTKHYKDTFYVDFSKNNIEKYNTDIDISGTFKYPNYFKGLPVEISGNKTYIKESLWTGNDRYIIKTGDSIDVDVSGKSFKIENIYNKKKTNFWVPYSMYSDNIYNENYYLFNDDFSGNTTIEGKKITNYDNKTSTISIDSPISDDIGKLSIRKSSNVKIIDICGNLSPINKLYIKDKLLIYDISGINNNVVTNKEYTNDDYLSNSFLRDICGNINRISNWKRDITTTYNFELKCYVDIWNKNTKGTLNVVKGKGNKIIDSSCNRVELLKFSRDNEIPLMVNGNTTERQNLTCYEISLLSLSLPNVILKNNYKVVNFPYFSVGLSNMSNYHSIDNGVIYSNNPNMKKSLFRATIHDTDNFEKSDFIKVNGDGMTQTIKFKPNDNLKFSVYLPNGELFQTRLEDNTSPSEPNQSIQISALFEIKKL